MTTETVNEGTGVRTETAQPSSAPASGSTAGYIKEPVTPEDHLHNCQFQLDNVKGWLMMAREEGGSTNLAAKMKAECLVEAARDLLKAIRKELPKDEW